MTATSVPPAERPPRISVIGGHAATPRELAWSEEVGRLLGRAGAVVVCGGLSGVMEAVCRGARSEGGMTIGILPRMDVGEANPYVLLPLRTGLGFARNVLVVYGGDAVIAVGGSVGTLSEIAYALDRRTPVFGLGTWDLDPKRLPQGAQLVAVATPEEAVRCALQAARAGRAEA